MSNGRIHAVLVATPTGSVVYERFYDNTTEAVRAEIRAAFQSARSAVGRKPEEGNCCVGNYKGAAFVFIPVGDVVFYAMGSGDYDELGLKEVLDTLILSLKDSLSRPPTEALLIEHYSILCLSLDEIILEGIFHNSDKDVIRKATKMKVRSVVTRQPWRMFVRGGALGVVKIGGLTECNVVDLTVTVRRGLAFKLLSEDVPVWRVS